MQKVPMSSFFFLSAFCSFVFSWPFKGLSQGPAELAAGSKSFPGVFLFPVLFLLPCGHVLSPVV